MQWRTLHILLVLVPGWLGAQPDSTGKVIESDSSYDNIISIQPQRPLDLKLRDSFSPILPPVDIRDRIYVEPLPGLVGKKLRDFYVMRNLNELLEQLPELYVRNYSVTGAAMPSFRGTGAGHTQVYWNGIPVNSSTLGVTDLSLSPMELFSEVQVLPGLESMRFGQGGIGGAIELGRRYGRSYQHKRILRAGVEGGSFGNLRTAFRYQTKGQQTLQSSTGIIFARGRNDFPFRNTTLPDSPEQRMPNAESQQIGFSEDLAIPFFQGGKLGLHLNSVYTDRNLPPSLLTTNLTESQTDFQNRAMLRYTGEFMRNRLWDLLVSGAHVYDQLRYQNGLAQIDSDTRSQQYVADVEVTDRRTQANSRHHFGARLARNQIQSDGLGGALGLGNGSFYVARAGKLARNVEMEVLVRQSFQGNEWTQPSGFVKWKYQSENPWPRRAQQEFYLTAGRNDRFPGLNDLYWEPGGNPDLENERAMTLEAGWSGWKRRDSVVDKGWLYDRFFAEANFYVSRIDNYILWTPSTSSFWTAENVQRVRSFGGEVALEYEKKFPQGLLEVRASYALSISENQRQSTPNDASIGQQLIYTPLHNGAVFAHFQLHAWKLEMGQQLTGKRYTTRDGTESLPAFTTGRVRLERPFVWGKQFKVAAYSGINNMWNARFEHLPFRPLPGRNYILGCVFHFL